MSDLITAFERHKGKSGCSPKASAVSFDCRILFEENIFGGTLARALYRGITRFNLPKCSGVFFRLHVHGPTQAWASLHIDVQHSTLPSERRDRELGDGSISTVKPQSDRFGGHWWVSRNSGFIFIRRNLARNYFVGRLAFATSFARCSCRVGQRFTRRRLFLQWTCHSSDSVAMKDFSSSRCFLWLPQLEIHPFAF